jgi:hypothetical protein
MDGRTYRVRRSGKSFGNGKAESQDGVFTGLEDWSFGAEDVILDAQKHQGGMGGMGGMMVVNGVH